MDIKYKAKYLKYKAKYLNLYNQLGGINILHKLENNSCNFCTIKDLPDGTELDNLVNFLLLNNIELNTDSPGVMYPNKKIKINFIDCETAKRNEQKIMDIIMNFDPNIKYEFNLNILNITNNNNNSCNFYTIKDLPDGTELDNLVNFLLLNNIELNTDSPGVMYPNKKIKINFIDCETAKRNKSKINDIIMNFDPNIKYHFDFNQISKKSKYIKPWNNESKIIYIALLIDPSSKLGQEIKKIYDKSPFQLNYDLDDFLTSPHITLLQIFILKGTMLDLFFSDMDNLKSFTLNVQKMFYKTFINNPQLFSKAGKYEKYGKFTTRVYNNKSQLTLFKKNNYEPFKNKVYELLFNIMGKRKKKIFIPNKSVSNTSRNTKETFSHFLIDNKKNPNTGFAISSFYGKDFIPHIALSKISETNDKIFIKKKSSVNLWSSNGDGSISYICVSYNKKHIYLKV